MFEYLLSWLPIWLLALPVGYFGAKLLGFIIPKLKRRRIRRCPRHGHWMGTHDYCCACRHKKELTALKVVQTVEFVTASYDMTSLADVEAMAAKHKKEFEALRYHQLTELEEYVRSGSP